MTTTTTTSNKKNNGSSSSYRVVAGSEEDSAAVDSNNDDIMLVHGKVVTPFCDQRKTELCLSFGAGVLLASLLFLAFLLSSSSSNFHHPTSPIMKETTTTTSEEESTSSLNMPPQFPTLNATVDNNNNEIIGTNNDDEDETTWWSNSKHTVKQWFGMTHQTKLNDHGRDWLLNAQTGTMVAKQDPSLFLGIGPAPLVLVHQDDDQKQLVFDLTYPAVDLVTTSGDFVGFEETDTDYSTLLVSPFLNEPISVTYQEDNFIVFQNDYVLEVESWNVVKDQNVNFVKKDGDVRSGGGCDWVWNSSDGTIRPKLNTNLVLGRGDRGLIVTRHPDQALSILHAKDLANTDIIGEKEEGVVHVVVPMDLGNGERQVVGVKQPKGATKNDGWRIKQTVLVDAGPIRVKYDGNFLLTPDEQFALEITDGRLEEGNTVNFVGGDD